jgi:hypothetical protein
VFTRLSGLNESSLEYPEVTAATLLWERSHEEGAAEDKAPLGITLPDHPLWWT